MKPLSCLTVMTFVCLGLSCHNKPHLTSNSADSTSHPSGNTSHPSGSTSNPSESASPAKQIPLSTQAPPPIPDSVWADYSTFVADSVLHCCKPQIAYYFRRYRMDTFPDLINKATLADVCRNLDRPGRIRYGHPAPKAFALHGGAYFSDTSLPRLGVDTHCFDIFPVGDIDENHISEIGLYYSSCASRYKSLYVYSLINDQWTEVGHCVFDIMYNGDNPDYRKFVRKTAKGKFEMLEITDLTGKEHTGKKHWLKFTIPL